MEESATADGLELSVVTDEGEAPVAPFGEAVMTSCGWRTAATGDCCVHVPLWSWARQRLSTTTPPSDTATL